MVPAGAAGAPPAAFRGDAPLTVPAGTRGRP
ncbi:MAG: hypothetical protein JWR28_2235, partial [Modestobacter sp.]|nr:hypothetical protein [Modestobacter sp.]